jgi:hypothetical protein
MRRVVTTLTVAVAAVALSSMVFAQAPAAKPAAKPVAATQPAPAAKPVAATPAVPKVVKTTKPLSVSGKVTKYDEATRMLTIGDKEFVLGPEAKIMAGAKAAPSADLTGKTVKVTYTVVDGKNVASMVRMPAAPKTVKK